MRGSGGARVASEDASGCGGRGAGPRSDSGCREVGAGSWARQAGGGCGGAGAVEAEGGRKPGARGAAGCVNSAVSPSGAAGAGGSGATTLDEGRVPLVRVRSGPPGPFPPCQACTSALARPPGAGGPVCETSLAVRVRVREQTVHGPGPCASHGPACALPPGLRHSGPSRECLPRACLSGPVLDRCGGPCLSLSRAPVPATVRRHPRIPSRQVGRGLLPARPAVRRADAARRVRGAAPGVRPASVGHRCPLRGRDRLRMGQVGRRLQPLTPGETSREGWLRQLCHVRLRPNTGFWGLRACRRRCTGLVDGTEQGEARNGPRGSPPFKTCDLFHGIMLPSKPP